MSVLTEVLLYCQWVHRCTLYCQWVYRQVLFYYQWLYWLKYSFTINEYTDWSALLLAMSVRNSSFTFTINVHTYLFSVFELPRINYEKFNGRPYQFMYGVDWRYGHNKVCLLLHIIVRIISTWADNWIILQWYHGKYRPPISGLYLVSISGLTPFAGYPIHSLCRSIHVFHPHHYLPAHTAECLEVQSTSLMTVTSLATS